jgi:hypothetical protein
MEKNWVADEWTRGCPIGNWPTGALYDDFPLFALFWSALFVFDNAREECICVCVCVISVDWYFFLLNVFYQVGRRGCLTAPMQSLAVGWHRDCHPQPRLHRWRHHRWRTGGRGRARCFASRPRGWASEWPCAAVTAPSASDPRVYHSLWAHSYGDDCSVVDCSDLCGTSSFIDHVK